MRRTFFALATMIALGAAPAFAQSVYFKDMIRDAPAATLPLGADDLSVVVQGGVTKSFTPVPAGTGVFTPSSCDGVRLTDVATTNGSTTISSATAGWSNADRGKPIVLEGAGAAGASLATTIVSVSGASAVIGAAAGATLSGVIATYGTNYTDTITSAIAAKYAELPTGICMHTSTFNISSQQSLIGRGSGANQLPATRLVWAGTCAAGSTQVLVNTGVSTSGIVLGNFMLDGAGCAGIGASIRGLNSGLIYPILAQRQTVSGIDFDGAANGSQDGQNLFVMSLESVQDIDASASADGVRLGTTINLNHGFIGEVRTRTKNGVGLHFVNADSMVIGQSFNQRISGGTGYGVKFDKGDANTAGHPSLANTILAVDPGAGGVYVEGSAADPLQSSRGHYIGFYNVSNSAAAETVDWSLGASLFIATTSSGRGTISGVRPTTFANLPLTPLEGMRAMVSDALVNSAGDAVTAGGGGSTVEIVYRGTAGAGGQWRVVQTTPTPNRDNLTCVSLATASALPNVVAGQRFCINDSNTSVWGATIASGAPNDTVLAVATSPTTFRVIGSVSGSPIRPQSVMFGGANLAAGSTTYVLPGASATASINDAAAIAPIVGTARNMRVRVQTAPGVGETYIVTLNKGAAGAIAATSLTCTISGTDKTCSDLTNTASLAAGNQWNATIVASGGAAGTGVWGIGFELDN